MTFWVVLRYNPMRLSACKVILVTPLAHISAVIDVSSKIAGKLHLVLFYATHQRHS